MPRIMSRTLLQTRLAVAAVLVVFSACFTLIGSAVSPAAAGEPVDVGGPLTADTTWTAAGGPYRVTSSVSVPAGITLTIEPGAVVRRGDTYASNRSMFEVAGTLVARGTAEQPITLEAPASSDSLFGGPPKTTVSTATGVIDVAHARLRVSQLLHYHSPTSSLMSTGAFAHFALTDTVVESTSNSISLAQVRSVALVRDAISLGSSSLVWRLEVNPANGPVTLHHNRLRSLMLTCVGTGTVVVRDTTFERMSSDSFDDGSGVRTNPGCGVDARGNYWETTGDLESRIIDGVDTEGLPLVDTAGRLTAPASGTPTLRPGWFTSYLQIRAYDTGVTSWWASAPDGGLPVTYTVEALPEGVWEAERTIETSNPYVVFRYLDTSERYRIRVTARNAAGAGQSITSELITPIDIAVPPSAPALSVTRTVGGADITWVSRGDGSEPVQSWNWTLHTSSGELVRSDNTAASAVSLVGLTPGASYVFGVAGVSGAGTGPTTTTSIVPGALPGAPTMVRATPNPAAATVTWTPPALLPGAPVTGYRVTDPYRGISARVPAGATSARVEGLRNGRSYRFLVIALSDVGDGPASAPSNAVTPADRPGRPRKVRAAARNNAARVTWRAAAANGASITSYRVTAYPGKKTVTVLGTGRSVTFKRLRPGLAYRFAVRAVNRVGAGQYSARTRSVRPY